MGVDGMSENILEFYETLGFEEVEVDDGLSALFFETAEDGSYALVTDEDGAVPDSLKKPVTLASYSAAGAFSWSAGFKNSLVFKEIWAQEETTDGKLKAVQKHREENEI